MKNWYAKTINAGSPHEQGLIIEESGGRNVAVAYDAKDGPMIAAAPELLNTLQNALARIEQDDEHNPPDVGQIRATIAKATGGAP